MQKVTIKEVLDILELPQGSFQVNLRDASQATEQLEAFKEKVKRQRKKLSKKYHPDLPFGDKEKMQLINSMVDLVMDLKIIQKPQPIRYNVYYYSDPANYSTTTSTSSSSTWT